MSESLQNVQQLTGEALAAAVAERVMGWESFTVQDVQCFTPSVNSSKVVRADTFRPDRDIAQAIAALEHLAGRKHWSWCIYRSDGTVAGPLYEVEITHAGKSHFGFSPLDGDGADSLPTAICKAALKAVEAANA